MATLDQSIDKLTKLTTQLNEKTDELNIAILSLETRLRDIKVGVSVWLDDRLDEAVIEDEEETKTVTTWLVGYAKVEDRWQLAAKKVAITDIEVDRLEYYDLLGPISLLKTPRVVRVAAAPLLEKIVQELAKKVEGFIESIENASKLSGDKTC